MGVLEPVEEAFEEEVPATPPGFRDLGMEEGSDDDLFSEPREEQGSVFSYNNELSFKNILPVLPAKGDFEDLLGIEGVGTIWKVRTTPDKKNYCSRCDEEVKKDLKKLAVVVENYKNERDATRSENEALKKEVEELKKLLKAKKENENADVKVTISNSKDETVDVLLKKKNFENARSIFKNNETSNKTPPKPTTKVGIQSFSISIPNIEPKIKKTVAELRKEFFEKEFQSEQKTFTSRNYLEIKPENKKEAVRSRLTIRIKPKQKINEIISKLTSRFGGSKIIPEAPQINMFQRFEKTRFSWKSDSDENVVV